MNNINLQITLTCIFLHGWCLYTYLYHLLGQFCGYYRRMLTNLNPAFGMFLMYPLVRIGQEYLGH